MGAQTSVTRSHASNERPLQYITPRDNIYCRNKQNLETYFHATICQSSVGNVCGPQCVTQSASQTVRGVFIVCCPSLAPPRSPVRRADSFSLRGRKMCSASNLAALRFTVFTQME